jgi:hypothetical protein
VYVTIIYRALPLSNRALICNNQSAASELKQPV